MPLALVQWLAEFVDLYYYPLLLAMVLVGLATVKRKRLFVIALLLTAFAAPLAKEAYAASRPCIGLETCPESFGFPSAHAALAVVFVLASIDVPAFYLFLLLALAVSFSRTYLGVHSLEQVAGGFALGAMVYLFLWVLLKRFEQSEFVQKHRLMH